MNNSLNSILTQFTLEKIMTKFKYLSILYKCLCTNGTDQYMDYNQEHWQIE